MLEVKLPDLRLSSMPTGSKGLPWDLKTMLFPGATGAGRRKSAKLIQQGRFGPVLHGRLPLVVRIHSHFDASLKRGDSPSTVRTHLIYFSGFVNWVDGTGQKLSIDTIATLFISWTDHLVWRYSVARDIKQMTAYRSACSVGSLVARALGYEQSEPARILMGQSRLRSPKRGQRTIEAVDERRLLSDTWSFGQLITDLCNGLTLDAIRGKLPLYVPLRDGTSVRLIGNLRTPDIDYSTIKMRPSLRARMVAVRDQLPVGADVTKSRPSLVNLRVEVELLLFIAQTGMNFSQALKLRREHYRWQTEGDELNAFRVYKGRRHGEAIFRCYQAYKPYLDRYLEWLDRVGVSSRDDRLFPFLYHKKNVPPEHNLPSLDATRKICDERAVRHIRPQELRRVRANWLLRSTGSLEVAASLSAHSVNALVRSYESLSVRVARAEILRFHEESDPTIAPPGPGVCASGGRDPRPVQNSSIAAPKPDCTSPDGCLFCLYHRDVMSPEYCLKLASHSYLKGLEALLAKPRNNSGQLSAHVVTDRIEEKLRAIAQGSAVRALWVAEARNSVRAGVHHPMWDTHIQLLEVLNGAT
jgi:hypothetical protein